MNTDDSGLDPNLSLTTKSSKTPLFVGIAVVVLGGGYFGYSAMKTRDERKLHASFMESFAALEKDDLGEFWACLLGPNVDVATFPDNLALSMRITSQFGVDAKNYPSKVEDNVRLRRSTCARKSAGNVGAVVGRASR